MMTGDEYRRSLRDGRTMYLAGRRVEEPDSEPAFSTPVGHVAAGYDRFYSAEPGAVNPMFVAPRSKESLRDRIPLFLEVDELMYLTYQCLMSLLTAAARIGSDAPQCVENIRRYVIDAQRRDIRVVECITDAKGDRSVRPGEQWDPDSYVRVVERRPDGVVVRGAKLHITGVPVAHELLVMPTKAMKSDEVDYSIAFAIPINTPGVKAINTTFHPYGDPRDHPISSRLSLPDAFVILDDVFVPNDRIFLNGQTRHASDFAHSLGLWERLGGTTLMVEQADQLVGLAQLIAEANGTDRISHIREKIAELAMHATLMRGALEASLATAVQSDDGFYYPNELYANAARYLAADGFAEAVKKLHDIAGGSVATVPSMRDLDNPDVGELVEKYMATSETMTGRYRMRLFHAIRDLTAGLYGGWWHVVNLHAGGGLYAQRLVTRKHYDLERAKMLARRLAGIPDDEAVGAPARSH